MTQRQVPHATDQRYVRAWVPRLAKLMDSQFRVPGTDFRFGLDPVIGFVPVLGDTATFIIGAAMLTEAKRLDARPDLYARMVGNLALDWFVGLIPGIDLILDTAVKAHTKNAELLERHANRSSATDSIVDTTAEERPASSSSQPLTPSSVQTPHRTPST